MSAGRLRRSSASTGTTGVPWQLCRLAFEINVESSRALVGIHGNAQPSVFDHRIQLRATAAERRFSGNTGMQLHIHVRRLALKHHAGLLAAPELVLLQAALEIVEQERQRGCPLMCGLVGDLQFRSSRLHLRGRRQLKLVLGSRQDRHGVGLA